MPTALKAPPYSFVQKGDSASFATCYPDPGDCLPLNAIGNIKFQLLATALSNAPLVFLPVRTIFAYPVHPDSDCNSHHDIDDLLIQPLIAREEPVTNIAGVESVFIFDIPMESFETSPLDDGIIEVGQCFKFKLIEVWTSMLDPTDILAVDVLGCTNCFMRIGELDLCHYSTITYSCNENTHGFVYQGNPSFGTPMENLVLLPFYLKNPQLTSEENSYRRSDGSYIKLSERIEEEYLLETDWWKHDWHRKFKLALSSDNIVMTNFNIAQQAFPLPNTTPLNQFQLTVSCKESYEIAWPEEMPGGAGILAKAKTKLTLSEPLVFTNSNCQ